MVEIARDLGSGIAPVCMASSGQRRWGAVNNLACKRINGDLRYVAVLDNWLGGENMLQRLLHIGFRSVGKWHLDGVRPVYSLVVESESRNVLYAFVSGSEVLYVGKTTQSLKKRLYGYQNPSPTQKTNVKGNAFLKEILDFGGAVEIFALPDHGLLHFGDFHLNLAAGLEDSLIAKLQPKWNGCGLKS